MTQLWTRAWTAFQALSARERLLLGGGGGNAPARAALARAS